MKVQSEVGIISYIHTAIMAAQKHAGTIEATNEITDKTERNKLAASVNYSGNPSMIQTKF